MGAYPELAAPERNFPDGRLDDFQEHRIRAWTTWNQGLGRAGELDLALLFRYDSARTFSLETATGFSAVQLARDPGYAGLPHGQTVFFGPRGSGEFRDSHAFDLAAICQIPAGVDALDLGRRPGQPQARRSAARNPSIGMTTQCGKRRPAEGHMLRCMA